MGRPLQQQQDTSFKQDSLPKSVKFEPFTGPYVTFFTCLPWHLCHCRCSFYLFFVTSLSQQMLGIVLWTVGYYSPEENSLFNEHEHEMHSDLTGFLVVHFM